MMMMLVTLAMLHGARATLLASSKINTCYDDGVGSSSNNMSCRPLLTMTFTVETNAQDEEKVILRDAVDEAGTKFPLESPVEITFSKQPSEAAYPLVYVQDVNTQPYEIRIITTQFQCGSDADKYCPKSGFCCRCSLCGMSGVCEETLRGSITCGFGEVASLVSCMRINETSWHAVYEIGSAQITNRVVVSIKIRNVTRRVVVGTLFPKVLVDGISVLYHGDLAASLATPTFESKYFVTNGRGSDAILDRNYFSLEGASGACDKIGVTATSYVAQSRRCETSPGACLHNQLPDLENIARERRRLRLTSSYFLSDYGTFARYRFNDNALVYTLPSQVRPSLLTIIANADDLVQIVNIVTIEALHFRFVAERLVMHNGRVQIIATLRNVGGVSGAAVISCLDDATDVVAVSETFRAREIKNVTLEGTMRGDSPHRRCNFTVVDARGKQCVSTVLEWHLLTRVVLQPQAREGEGSGGGGQRSIAVLKPPPGSAREEETCTSCPWYNPLCFLGRRCFWQSVINVAVVLLIGIVCVVLMRRFLATSQHRARNPSPTILA